MRIKFSHENHMISYEIMCNHMRLFQPGFLLLARDRARRLLNPVQKSANPSGGQPIATTSNSTQTSSKKSTRRNKNPIRKIPAGTGVNHRRRRR